MLDRFFYALKLNQDFLVSDPETWPQLQDYNSAKKIVSSVHVVNYCAKGETGM